jgi:hypothetical protein
LPDEEQTVTIPAAEDRPDEHQDGRSAPCERDESSTHPVGGQIEAAAFATADDDPAPGREPSEADSPRPMAFAPTHPAGADGLADVERAPFSPNPRRPRLNGIPGRRGPLPGGRVRSRRGMRRRGTSRRRSPRGAGRVRLIARTFPPRAPPHSRSSHRDRGDTRPRRASPRHDRIAPGRHGRPANRGPDGPTCGVFRRPNGGVGV